MPLWGSTLLTELYYELMAARVEVDVRSIVTATLAPCHWSCCPLNPGRVMLDGFNISYRARGWILF